MGKSLNKKALSARERTKYKIRKKISGNEERPRISVFRSGQHMYAQAINDIDGKTIASASTLDKTVQDEIGSVSAEGIASEAQSTRSCRAAKAVGVVLGKRCKEKQVMQAVFDRNGLKYHGRVKAVADGFRESGLKL